jgi:hypothetical protein
MLLNRTRLKQEELGQIPVWLAWDDGTLLPLNTSHAERINKTTQV